MSKTGKPTKEYKVEKLEHTRGAVLEEYLNALAVEGWRLVPIALGYGEGWVTLVFERGKYIE